MKGVAVHRNCVSLSVIVVLLAGCMAGNGSIPAPIAVEGQSGINTETTLFASGTAASTPFRQTGTPQPTSTITRTPQNTPTNTVTSTVFPNPFPEWPLSPGNRWVYISTIYSGQFKAKYQITDEVERIFIDEEKFRVDMNRKMKFLEGDRMKTGYYGFFGPGSYTLMIDDAAVIQDWQVVLQYPLAAYSYWAHSINESEIEPVVGKNVWLNGPLSKIVVDQEHQDCYEIVYQYLSGEIGAWFCPGIGFVESVYDHNGTPFGYHEVLIEYSIK